MRRSKSIAIGGLIFALLLLTFSFSYATEKKPPPKTTPEKTTPKPYDKLKPAKPLPDLVVEKVWLDNEGYINFQVKNKGTGHIPDPEHRRGMVVVSCGKSQEDFSFSKILPKKKLPVDPKGALKQPGKSVVYNTKIRLKTRQTITVLVDSTGKITESNDNNNSLAQQPTTTVMAEKPEPKESMLRPESKWRDMKLESEPSGPGSATPTGRRRPMLLHRDDSNIRITSPSLDDVFFIGSWIDINYEITSEEREEILEREAHFGDVYGEVYLGVDFIATLGVFT